MNNKELLQQALERICMDAPTELPDQYGGDNHGNTAHNAAECEHFRLAEIARAALAQPEQATGSTYQEGFDDANRLAHKHILQLREELTKALAKGETK